VQLLDIESSRRHRDSQGQFFAQFVLAVKQREINTVETSAAADEQEGAQHEFVTR
jgi:hypothetical protein